VSDPITEPFDISSSCVDDRLLVDVEPATLCLKKSSHLLTVCNFVKS